MKYKMIDYISVDSTEVQTGTCDLCFGIGIQNNDVLLLEDEEGQKIQLRMHDWDWGDITNFHIDNIVNFAAWLKEQCFEDELSENSTYRLFQKYEDKED